MKKIQESVISNDSRHRRCGDRGCMLTEEYPQYRALRMGESR